MNTPSHTQAPTQVDRRPCPILYSALNPAVFEAIPPSAARILDLGCGTGSLGAALKTRGVDNVTGVTFSAEEAALARERLDEVLVADLDSFNVPASFPTFDVIVCSHVLEHLRDPGRLLRVIRACLAPGGLLVVALPNALHWKQRLRFLRGEFKYTEGGLMDSTHFRFFDWETARDLVAQSGYVIRSAAAAGNFPLPIIRRFLPEALCRGIDIQATCILPGFFGFQFVILAQAEPAPVRSHSG